MFERSAYVRFAQTSFVSNEIQVLWYDLLGLSMAVLLLEKIRDEQNSPRFEESHQRPSHIVDGGEVVISRCTLLTSKCVDQHIQKIFVRTTTTSNLSSSSSPGSPLSSAHTACMFCTSRLLKRSTTPWLMSTPTRRLQNGASSFETRP
jgi:hypothetical protein